MTVLETLILWSAGLFIGAFIGEGLRIILMSYHASIPKKKKPIDPQKLKRWMEYK